jgi:hypothetical protein
MLLLLLLPLPLLFARELLIARSRGGPSKTAAH